MAEIDVERRGPTIWPWIIGLVVLAVVIWLVAEILGEEPPVVSERVEQVGGPAPPRTADDPVRLVST